MMTPNDVAERLNAIFGDAHVTTKHDKEYTSLLVQSIAHLDERTLRGMTTIIAWSAELESIERKRRKR